MPLHRLRLANAHQAHHRRVGEARQRDRLRAQPALYAHVCGSGWRAGQSAAEQQDRGRVGSGWVIMDCKRIPAPACPRGCTLTDPPRLLACGMRERRPTGDICVWKKIVCRGARLVICRATASRRSGAARKQGGGRQRVAGGAKQPGRWAPPLQQPLPCVQAAAPRPPRSRGCLPATSCKTHLAGPHYAALVRLPAAAPAWAAPEGYRCRHEAGWGIGRRQGVSRRPGMASARTQHAPTRPVVAHPALPKPARTAAAGARCQRDTGC